jgi:hypothetical protein
MKGRLDGMKVRIFPQMPIYYSFILQRVSQRMFDGLSVAQGEYDNEVASRRDAEAEVSRLRLQLAAQSAELTALNADQRKRDLMEKMSKDMSDSLHGLEQDLSKLKAERDLTLAEVEELVSNREYVYCFIGNSSVLTHLMQRCRCKRTFQAVSVSDEPIRQSQVEI